jgi:hypothetical protein
MWHTTWRMGVIVYEIYILLFQINPPKKRLSTWMLLYVCHSSTNFDFEFDFLLVMWEDIQILGYMFKKEELSWMLPKIVEKKSVELCSWRLQNGDLFVVGKVQIHVNWGQRKHFPKGTITKSCTHIKKNHCNCIYIMPKSILSTWEMIWMTSW